MSAAGSAVRSTRHVWLAMAVLAVLIGVVATLHAVTPARSRVAGPHPQHPHLRHRRLMVARATGASWPPALGVYAGPGAAGAAQAFNEQVGGSVTYALDFLDSSSWATISDPQWTIRQWSASPFRMMFAVPMLPDSGATLASGATGAYDPNFLGLATHLIATGDGNAVLMIGWDPLQSGLTWQVATRGQAAEYVSYFRHIVATMRAVPGANFLFEWNGGGPKSGMAPSAVYPGDGYVDLIATNVFDELTAPPKGSRWNTVATQAYGPDWYSQLATDHDKPLVLAEWGLVPSTTPGGGGDDPAFVHDFMQWCGGHRVALVITWDYGSWAISSGAFPASEAALASGAASGSWSSTLGSLSPTPLAGVTAGT